MYTPVERSGRIFELVVAQIEARILDGALRDGDYLGSERQLAEEFGVSRTAVREALKTLAQKGLVDMQHGRGTRVVDGTSRAIRHSLYLMLRVRQGRQAGRGIGRKSPQIKVLGGDLPVNPRPAIYPSAAITAIRSET